MEIRAGGGGLWPWKSGWEGGHSDPGNPGGRGGQKTLPSVGGVWIFSGITQYCLEDFHSFGIYINYPKMIFFIQISHFRYTSSRLAECLGLVSDDIKTGRPGSKASCLYNLHIRGVK